MKVGVPREVHDGERRVAATPETVKRLHKLGFEVLIEKGAGANANLTDEAYEAADCTIVDDPRTLWAESDIVIKVRPPEQHPELGVHETELVREGGMLISFLWPAQNPEILEQLNARKATALAMDMIPRITRAQKMDALSSMANIAGYRAVLEAANAFGRSMLGQITAAGKIPAGKVMVIGAGVAGLAAIGTARGLGAIVRAFDVRPAVREQVQSMGAEFLEVDIQESGEGSGGYAKTMSKEFIEAEMALFKAQAREVDIIITTALIPGKRAPTLITKDMLEVMKKGSVVVDLASEQGGNCEATVPGEVVQYEGVTIIGHTDMPSRLPTTASQLYGTNIAHLLSDLGGVEKWDVNLEDEVIRGALATHQGETMYPPPKKDPPKPKQTKSIVGPAKGQETIEMTAADVAKAASKAKAGKGGGSRVGRVVLLGVGIAFFMVIGLYAPRDFLNHFTVFVLACFVGYQVVWNVAPALHTPLMSVTNAISGIIILGGMLHLGSQASGVQMIVGAIAVLIATVNIAGGFLVTQRMLKMFHK